MNTWSYIAATSGLVMGCYLMFKLKKWKHGAWISCLSLAVFAGSHINVSKFISADNSFNYSQQIASLSNDVSQLRLQLVQSVTITQTIVQTVNMITEVRREVADVKALLLDFYSRSRNEYFGPGSTNRVSIYTKADGAHVVVLALENSPILESVSCIASIPGTGQMPLLPSGTKCFSNMVVFQFGAGAGDLNNASYSISYAINPSDSNRYSAVVFRDKILELDGKGIIKLE